MRLAYSVAAIIRHMSMPVLCRLAYILLNSASCMQVKKVSDADYLCAAHNVPKFYTKWQAACTIQFSRKKHGRKKLTNNALKLPNESLSHV